MVFDYKANVTPPKDYNQWATLIHKLVSHWVEQYGLDEVSRWPLEVWNEPNLKAFWSGTQADYFKLYHTTVETIKAIDGSLQVGGPSSAKNEWIDEFLDFCDREGLPADFVTTHHYPTDAFGQPGDDTETQLAKSRRSVLRDQAQRAHQQARGRPLYYTEWNSSSNPRDHLHDEPYAAAFVVKTIMEATGLVEGYSFWTFTDIFEENYFPSTPFHGGFGLLNLHGIPKPTYRAYQLLHGLGTELLAVVGKHQTVDAWAVRNANSVMVMLTNHALPRHSIRSEQIQIVLSNSPQPKTAYVQRIDAEHANPRRLWQEMGKPDYLSTAALEQLQAAARLTYEPVSLQAQNGAVQLNIDLPPHAVAALTVEFVQA
jgi:xylan 1,4-beta-xylosidase